MMKNVRSVQTAAFALGMVFALSAHAQIVTNGDFESGFNGWTINSSVGDPWTIATGGVGAFTGGAYASTGCVGGGCIDASNGLGGNYLYEDLNTVVNATYTLSFAFSGAGGGGGVGDRLPLQSVSALGTAQELLVSFGGVTVFDLPDNSSTYTVYSQNVTALSSITRLEFQGRQDPSFNALDDVSLTLVAATPEPGTTLLGLSAALLFLVAVRFRKTHSGRIRTEN